MGRPKECLTTKIDRAIKTVGDKCIVRSAKTIVCKKCGDNIEFKEEKISCRIRDHLKGRQHKESLQNKQNVQLIREVLNGMNEKEKRENEFRDKLLTSMTGANIAFNKLMNPNFRGFLQWLIDSPPMDVKVPHPRTLGRNLKGKYKQMISQIKRKVKGKDVYILVDETPDSESRNVVNVMVGLLDDTQTKPMLINVEFPKVVNNETIQEIVMNTCAILWKGNIYPHLKLIVSDQAAYMLAAVRKLKGSISFPNLLHVTCIIHAVHLVCDSIRKEFTLVNTLFSGEKKFFKNSGKKKRKFKEITGLKLIPSPVLSRWGSWLNCVNYHLLGNNMKQIKSFFLKANTEHGIAETDALELVQQILRGQKLEKDLFNLSKYSPMPSLITKMEAQFLPLSKQIELLKQVQSIIKGTVHESILSNSLAKNPDFDLITGDTQELGE